MTSSGKVLWFYLAVHAVSHAAGLIGLFFIITGQCKVGTMNGKYNLVSASISLSCAFSLHFWNGSRSGLAQVLLTQVRQGNEESRVVPALCTVNCRHSLHIFHRFSHLLMKIFTGKRFFVVENASRASQVSRHTC